MTRSFDPARHAAEYRERGFTVARGFFDADEVAKMRAAVDQCEALDQEKAPTAITDGGPWQELDHEDILRLAPDAILLFRPAPVDHRAVGERPRPTAAEAMEALRGIGSLDIPAVREGRVAIIDHPLGLLPASSLAEVADEIAEAFEDWTD